MIHIKTTEKKLKVTDLALIFLKYSLRKLIDLENAEIP